MKGAGALEKPGVRSERNNVYITDRGQARPFMYSKLFCNITPFMYCFITGVCAD